MMIVTIDCVLGGMLTVSCLVLAGLLWRARRRRAVLALAVFSALLSVAFAVATVGIVLEWESSVVRLPLWACLEAWLLVTLYRLALAARD